MDKLIQSIASNDFVKVKQCFAEAMEAKVKQVVENRKVEIAASIMIEGEEKALDDDENDEDDEDDEDE